ncbi:multidrug efflux SMR transporter [Pleomorphomonas sp. NRK KF1]|uniref:DMT family transporter n=1 Tax=Pleomorphomonas sp. NRK KF1 TaxID=2943000 RepID=UPI0020446084|nr:multidrug efflux SMR transporter [Pleomorphomonas sp. NRK KF1]MCM5555052.1 multidrug efflux SMR transporter [Pleomorphomonas sp. NRK KF1]
MNPPLAAYGFLALAIVSEVTGSSLLQKSEQFSKALPTIGMAICFTAAFFFLSQALKVIPLAIAYAIWSGVGIVLTAAVGVLVFRQALDLWAMVGMSLIVLGAIVLNTMSRSAVH